MSGIQVFLVQGTTNNIERLQIARNLPAGVVMEIYNHGPSMIEIFTQTLQLKVEPGRRATLGSDGGTGVEIISAGLACGWYRTVSV